MSKKDKGERQRDGDARGQALCPPEGLLTCDIHIFPQHFRVDLVRPLAHDWYAATTNEEKEAVWQREATKLAEYFAGWGFEEYQIKDNLLLLWRAVRREVDRLRDEAKRSKD